MENLSSRSKNTAKELINILHVDGSLTFLNTTKRYLEGLSNKNKNLNIETCQSPNQAFTRLGNNNNFDLIISSYLMKPVNGLEFLSKIRNELESQIPFIIFTGKGREEIAIHALNLGADYYVKKGPDLHSQYTELLHAILSAIEHKRTEKALLKSQGKFQSLFMSTPIGQAERDYSAVKIYLDALKKTGIKNFDQYFDNHPEIVLDCAKKVKILDVNPAALRMFNANSKSEFADIPYKFMDQPPVFNAFKKQLLLIINGVLQHETVAPTQTPDGSKFFIKIIFHVPKEFQNTYSRVWTKYVDITELKTAEETLSKSQQLLKDILENTSAAVYMKDLEDKYILVNKHFEQIVGYSRKELIGKTPSQLYPPEMITYIQFQDQQILKNQIPMEFEEINLRQKPPRTYLTVKFPLFDSQKKLYAIGGISTDITDKKRAKQILHEKEIAEQKLVQLQLRNDLELSEGKFRSLVENAPDMIVTTDLSGIVTFINYTIPGFTIDQMLGNSFFNFVNPEEQSKIEEYFDQVKCTGKAIGYEYEGPKNLPPAWYYVRLGALKSVGNITGLIFILRDITDQKNTELTLQQHAIDLERVNAELKEFAYVVSHDLKSPLDSIKMMINLYNSESQNLDHSQVKTNLSQIDQKIDMMERMIDGILQYSNIEISEETHEVININELVSEVIKTLNPPTTFKFDVSQKLPFVKFNKFRVYQLFQNLISNAINHNDKKDGYVKISCKFTNSNNYEFSINDNGVGIKQENFERVFHLFETTNRRSPNSTGIGLAIVKKIINLLNGRIWIDSTLGKGSSFYFTISDEFCSLDTKKLK